MAFPILAGLGMFLSGGMSAASSILGSDAQAKAMEFNAELAEKDAAIAEQNATFVAEQAKDDIKRVRVMGRRTLGEMRANFGASGLQTDGSALDLLAESAAVMEEDVLNVRTQASRQSQTYRMEADRKRTYAEMVRSGAASTRTGGYIAAGGQLLGAAADVYSKMPSSRSVKRSG